MMALVIIISLLFNSFAAPVSVEATRLVNAYNLLPIDSTDISILKDHAKRVSNFLSDNKKRGETSKDNLETLILKNTHLMNFIAVADRLKSCQGSLKSKEMVDKILAVVATDSNLVSCSRSFSELTAFDKFLNDMNKITSLQIRSEQKVSLNSLRDESLNRALINSLTSYIDLHLKYDGKEVTPDEVVKEICLKKCNKHQLELMKGIASDQLNEIKAKREKPFGHMALLQQMNQAIVEMNHDLKRVEKSIDVEEEFTMDGPYYLMKPTKSTEQVFNEYQRKFLSAAQTPKGRLLISKTSSSKIGGLRNSSSPSLYGNTPTIKPHPLFELKDVENAISEVRSDLQKNIHRLLEMEDRKERGNTFGVVKSSILKKEIDLASDSLMTDLKRLVRTNPLSVGQVLKNHPEYSGDVCELITKASKDIEKDEKWHKVATFTTAAVGVALIVGTGMLFGAGLLAGGTLLGSASALTTTSMIIAGAGTAISVADTGIYYKRRREMAETRAEFVGAIYAGGKSTDLAADILELEKEISSNNIDLYLSAGSLLPLGGLAKGARYIGAKLTKEEAKELIRFTSRVETGKYRPMLERIEKQFGVEKRDSFFGSILTLKPKDRELLLDEFLRQWKGDPLLFERGLMLSLDQLLTSKKISASEMSKMVSVLQSEKVADLVVTDGRVMLKGSRNTGVVIKKEGPKDPLKFMINPEVIDPSVAKKIVSNPDYRELFKMGETEKDHSALIRLLATKEVRTTESKKTAQELSKKIKSCMER